MSNEKKHRRKRMPKEPTMQEIAESVIRRARALVPDEDGEYTVNQMFIITTAFLAEEYLWRRPHL